MKQDVITDEYLAMQAQQGDIEAEETLMRRYKPIARKKSKLYFIAGADEEDVVQEGMIGLFKAVRQYSPDRNASFGTFAGVCITRQIISAIRTADRKKHEILNSSVSLNNPIASDREELVLEDMIQDDGADNPETLLVLNDLIDYILHNDNQWFSEFEVQVFQGLLAGKERNDIADELGKSRKSVDNAMSRMRKKIATFIWE